jgi:glucosamine--fructose-6-phosphate aminotransferase (isomerizing)
MFSSSYRIARRLSAVRRVISNDTSSNLNLHSGCELMNSGASFNYNDSAHHGKWDNAGSYRYTGLLGLMVACGVFLVRKADEKSENCGIVGVVGMDDANDYLLEGLTILKNRGYDSAGVATISPTNELTVSKFASRDTTSDCIDLVRKDSANHTGHRIGIAHTRWATHGGKTDANAHPHTDYNKNIALIHNGTINNSHELRKELQDSGIKFTSETDTEVIAHLVGIGIDAGLSTKEAVEKALARCDGSWGLAVINKKHTDEMVVACNGSPLVIGLGQGKTFVASETSAFSRYTKNFVAMKDGEIGIVRATTNTLDLTRMEVAPDHEILLTPAPYAHFTLKEALEQPEAIARALSYVAVNCRGIMLSGCG